MGRIGTENPKLNELKVLTGKPAAGLEAEQLGSVALVVAATARILATLGAQAAVSQSGFLGLGERPAGPAEGGSRGTRCI